MPLLFSVYGNLTVRGLLDTINQCLKEFDFPDPYLTVRTLYFFKDVLILTK